MMPFAYHPETVATPTVGQFKRSMLLQSISFLEKGESHTWSVDSQTLDHLQRFCEGQARRLGIQQAHCFD